MEIIAHRGASASAPENTLAAFDLAHAQQADGLEFDVRLAACGTPVVIHDATLQRTHGMEAAVDTLEAGALEALGVPLLATVLWRYGEDMRLFVEAKTRQAAVAAAAQMALLHHAGMEAHRQILISFDHSALAEARALYPAVMVGASFEAPPVPRQAKALACHPAWLVVRADGITPTVATEAQQQGLLIAAWTVNDHAESRRLKALGVQALMTDTPLAVRAGLYE